MVMLVVQIGYAAFGEETRDIITLNLPQDWTTVAVKLALCLGLLFTFPVMMVPVFEILERSLKQKVCKHSHRANDAEITDGVSLESEQL